jgi:hypothetical protein
MEFEGRGVTQLFAVSLSSAVGLLVGGELLSSFDCSVTSRMIQKTELMIALVWGLSAE